MPLLFGVHLRVSLSQTIRRRAPHLAGLHTTPSLHKKRPPRPPPSPPSPSPPPPPSPSKPSGNAIRPLPPNEPKFVKTPPAPSSTKPKNKNTPRPPTSDELKLIETHLREGCQPWEVAIKVGRSETFINHTLSTRPHLARLRQQTKSGKWSAEEDRLVLDHLSANTVPDVPMLAKKLGRTESSVRARIYLLAKQRESKPPVPLSALATGELSLEERLMLRSRLNRILDGLLKSKKSEAWGRVLGSMSRDEWAASILALIPPPLGHILAAQRAPALDDLAKLKWEDTSRIGVYAWILKRRIINPMQHQHYLYVGSATSCGGGLAQRRLQHESGKASDGVLQKHIRELPLGKKNGQFVTLLSLPVEAFEFEKIQATRRKVVVAETVLMVWLGAVAEKDGMGGGGEGGGSEERAVLYGLYPRNMVRPAYPGLCFHNPLLGDLDPV